jgi:hypothetical protein
MPQFTISVPAHADYSADPGYLAALEAEAEALAEDERLEAALAEHELEMFGRALIEDAVLARRAETPRVWL